MKRKELIEKLLRYGDDDTEVCVQNSDIQDVIISPAYWDGTLETTKRSGDKYICKYVREGSKIVLFSQSISELTWDWETEIDYSELDESKMKYLQDKHNEIRKQAANIEYEAERSVFFDWVVWYLKNQNHNFSAIENLSKLIEDTDEFFRGIYKTYKFTLPANKSWADMFKDWLSNNYYVVYIYDKISVLKRG